VGRPKRRHSAMQARSASGDKGGSKHPSKTVHGQLLQQRRSEADFRAQAGSGIRRSSMLLPSIRSLLIHVGVTATVLSKSDSGFAGFRYFGGILE